MRAKSNPAPKAGGAKLRGWDSVPGGTRKL